MKYLSLDRIQIECKKDFFTKINVDKEIQTLFLEVDLEHLPYNEYLQVEDDLVLGADMYIYPRLEYKEIRESHNTSLNTLKPLSDSIPIPIRVICNRWSKLRGDKLLGKNVNVGVIARTGKESDGATLFLERAVGNYSGKIQVYSLKPEGEHRFFSHSFAIINFKEIEEDEYYTINADKLYQQYEFRDFEHLSGKVFTCTDSQAEEINKVVDLDKQKVIDRTLRYSFWPDKYYYDFISLVVSARFENSCTWIREVLLNAGVINKENTITFDENFGVKVKDKKWFLGSTPDKVVFFPKNRRQLQDENTELNEAGLKNLGGY